jgi:predicted short-subunit dehydrogenase-like oxidoreductase (DUF2520 family)
MRQGRLSVGLIGSQLEGVAILQALVSAGHELWGISEATEHTEALLPQCKVADVESILAQADLVLLAVAESQIETTVESLAAKKLWRGGQLVVHLSPEFGHEVLHPAVMLGAIPLAIFPAMSFTGTSLDLIRIKESFFAVSAPAVALPIAQALVIEMGAEPVVISSEQRASFSEAVAVASNFSAMIVNQAIGLLEQAGIENPAAVVAPVVKSAVDQALAKGHRRIDPEDLIGES